MIAAAGTWLLQFAVQRPSQTESYGPKHESAEGNDGQLQVNVRESSLHTIAFDFR